MTAAACARSRHLKQAFSQTLAATATHASMTGGSEDPAVDTVLVQHESDAYSPPKPQLLTVTLSGRVLSEAQIAAGSYAQQAHALKGQSGAQKLRSCSTMSPHLLGFLQSSAHALIYGHAHGCAAVVRTPAADALSNTAFKSSQPSSLWISGPGGPELPPWHASASQTTEDVSMDSATAVEVALRDLLAEVVGNTRVTRAMQQVLTCRWEQLCTCLVHTRSHGQQRTPASCSRSWPCPLPLMLTALPVLASVRRLPLSSLALLM